MVSSISRIEKIIFFGPQYVSHWSLWTSSEPDVSLHYIAAYLPTTSRFLTCKSLPLLNFPLRFPPLSPLFFTHDKPPKSAYYYRKEGTTATATSGTEEELRQAVLAGSAVVGHKHISTQNQPVCITQPSVFSRLHKRFSN